MLSTRNFTNKIIRRWRIKGWKMIHYKNDFLWTTICEQKYQVALCVSVCVCVRVWLWNVDAWVLVYMWRPDKSSSSWVISQDSSFLVFLRQRLSHCDHPSWYSWNKDSHCDLRLIDSARLTGLRAPRIHLPQPTQHLDYSRMSPCMPFQCVH